MTRSALNAVPLMRDGVGGADGSRPSASGDAGGHGVGALGGVVETFVPHGRHVAQAALHLVSDGERGQEVPAGLRRRIRRRPGRRPVVAGMARLARGQVAVVEIEVANQRAVVEGCAVRSRLPPADQAAQRRTAKLGHLLPDQARRLTIERANRASEGVESPDFQLFSCYLGKVIVRRSHREIRELLDNRHDVLRSLRGGPQALS